MKCKFKVIDKTSRVYNTEKCAREYAGKIQKKKGYKPVVYGTTQNKWAVLR